MLELESFEPKPITRPPGPPAPPPAAAAAPVGWRKSLARHLRLLRKNRTLLLMAAPGLLLLLIFNYLPMAGIIIAFKNFKTNKGILGSDWVGLSNFQFLFGTDTAWRITANTLLLNSLFIVTGIAASLAIALLLNEVKSRVLARFYQSAVFFPYFVSWIIVGYFGFAILNSDNGMLNHWLARVGLGPVAWYREPQYWPLILTFVNLWKTAGYWSIIYLAAMYAIGHEYYEAAMLDGASRWQQIVYVTLPMLLPLIITNFLLSVGRIFFADFGLFYYVTRDSSMLYPTTDVIDTYVFRALRSVGDFGMAAAAGLYQSFVGFVLVVAANWIVKRIDREKSLF